MNKFTFKVYNNRRSCFLTYDVKKTNEGWHVSHIAINGDCSPDGTPYFKMNFDQDFINYPNRFGNYLEWLWEQIENGEIVQEEAQKKLQELADWVTSCEQNRPSWDGWNQ